MGQQNKANLKGFFQTGFKPTQQNFADLIDSYPNKSDDGISVDGSKNVSLEKGITIGNSDSITSGTIRYNSTSSVFEFREGATWKTLGGGASQWTTIGTDINYASGKVGIGIAPTYKLEVELNNATTNDNKIRFGNATIFSRNDTAFFSHKDFSTTDKYGFAHDLNGQTAINCAATSKIVFSNGNSAKMILAGGILNIGAAADPGGCLLVVNGDAAKPTGGTWKATSDERLKSDITPFTDGLGLLKKLEPVRYKFNGKAGIISDQRHVGLIAQKVQKIFPYMIGNFKAMLNESDSEPTELLSLDASALTYVMLNAIKELDEKLTVLEKKTEEEVY